MIEVAAVLRRLGIEAKRQGREWIALCPNPEHDDKRPGWRIRDEERSKKHGYHHCWACGFGGSIEKLVATVLGVSKTEARTWLGGDAVREDRPVAGRLEVKLRPWDSSFRIPAGVDLSVPFERWPGSAKRYAEERRIPPEQLDRWGVGFAVEGRLAGRIVFLKRDEEGRAAGYSARTFVGDSRRYLEAEPWEGASPAVMFGEHLWPAESERYRVFVAEGAINALALERAFPGDSVAALSGSVLSPIAAAKLSTFDEIVIVSDPDAAGDKLAGTLEAALARSGKNVRRVRLPEGEDAASVPTEALRELAC